MRYSNAMQNDNRDNQAAGAAGRAVCEFKFDGGPPVTAVDYPS